MTLRLGLIAMVLAGCGAEQVPPASMLQVGNDGSEVEVSHAGLRAFVKSRAYAGWTAEPAVRNAILGSPHGKVRVFFNKTSHDGLKASALPLPVGSMIVKEAYDADGTILGGYAAMLKTGEASWTWWEAFGNLDSPAAFAVDTPGCKGCHSGAGNKDQVLTPAP